MAKVEAARGSEPTNTAYTVLEQSLGTARHVRIITIGAGASGINTIRTLRTFLTNYTHIVYEKNPKVGGTWYENRYPGCKCDIPAHNYQYSWKPNPEWSSFSGSAEEIEAYFCRVCEEEDLEREIRTEHRVVEAKWSERGVWELKVEDLRARMVFEDYCHFLLDASGILNNWKWPQIPGLHDFKGELIHSANWPESFEHSGKKVAVIGNGSSGVQIVPAIQLDVTELVHFIRSPTWIAPPSYKTWKTGKAGEILGNLEMDGEKFSSKQIEKFKNSPQYYLEFVKTIEEQINSRFPMLLKDSEAQAQAFKLLSMYMTTLLKNDSRLCKALIPSFPVGCRRLTPGPGYLESLMQDNVRVVTNSIVKVVPTGIEISTGEIIEVDSLICATGFDLSFRPRFPLIGRKGNLQDLWTENLPRAYMSCAVPEFPNFFMFLGPNCPIGHGSVITITEHMSKYIASIIHKCQTEGIASLSPSHEALDAYSARIDAFMPRTAWAGTCRSWFKNGRETGPVTALHPGSRIHWFHMLERFRGEDFEHTYEGGQRFGYLGNGFSTKELEGGGDPTWYLGTLGAEL
ncbi:FAD/NAD(P)-binding domain-containing protein [Stipitochalara longipes BDJ]|nr:FAD/NAD(P)-binding domain-containing protein [Stipitochalara longipes BDJ]